jgi:hypothetical protein
MELEHVAQWWTKKVGVDYQTYRFKNWRIFNMKTSGKDFTGKDFHGIETKNFLESCSRPY